MSDNHPLTKDLDSFCYGGSLLNRIYLHLSYQLPTAVSNIPSHSSWALATHPTDPHQLLTGSEDGSLFLWDTESKTLVSPIRQKSQNYKHDQPKIELSLAQKHRKPKNTSQHHPAPSPTAPTVSTSPLAATKGPSQSSHQIS